MLELQISHTEFKDALTAVAADSSILSAGEESASDFDLPIGLPDEAQATEALLDAIQRLEDEPSLLSGDPDLFFTYEDPILAVAVRACQIHAYEIATAGPPGDDLRNSSLFKWARVGVHAYLSRHDASVQELAGRTPIQTVDLTGEKVRIAILGDAGYLGQSQDNVIQSILQRHSTAPFDLVIHLGDTYFGGDEAEMLKNLLDPLSSLRNAGMTVYTLVGNHDLYYGAHGYVAALNILNQPGRYFLIETPDWRIACLDTATGALGILRSDARLDGGQLKWLDSLLKVKDNRPLVLMSHHFIVSGWGTGSPTLTQQMKSRGKKVFAWYWGHEHACATYERLSNGFYGACIGNGAFVERWSKPITKSAPAWYATTMCTCYPNPKKKHYWPHGFLELEISKDTLDETYHIENGETACRTLHV